MPKPYQKAAPGEAKKTIVWADLVPAVEALMEALGTESFTLAANTAIRERLYDLSGGWFADVQWTYSHGQPLRLIIRRIDRNEMASIAIETGNASRIAEYIKDVPNASQMPIDAVPTLKAKTPTEDNIPKGAVFIQTTWGTKYSLSEQDAKQVYDKLDQSHKRYCDLRANGVESTKAAESIKNGKTGQNFYDNVGNACKRHKR